MIEKQSCQFPLRAKLPNYLFTTLSMFLKIKPILYWNNITFEKKVFLKYQYDERRIRKRHRRSRTAELYTA